MNYIEYIKEHKDDINTTCKKVFYKDIYKKSFDDLKNEVFRKVLAEFKNKGEMERADIFKEVEKGNLYKAFFMIILWGGINKSNLNLVISYIESKGEEIFVKEHLQETSKLVNDNKVSEAFNRLKKGTYHIDGIGVSFFTKLLYFFDTSKLGEKALIFDKWSKKEHCALLISDDTVDYKQYYTLTKSGNQIGVKCTADELKLFLDYIQRIKNISSIIKQPNIGKVEEFLFGIPKLRTSSNPRRVLNDFLFHYCQESNTQSKKKVKASQSKQSNKNGNDRIILEYEALYNDLICKLFVAYEESRGYYCEIRYKNHTNESDNILLDGLIEKYEPSKWFHRKDTYKKPYRYIVFGKGEGNCQNACDLAYRIKNDLGNQ
ncbi:MAG: hypothetical protein K5918_07645 [Bacteroidales bacterium]|nr:hypothetical protein [Bacteroidales bacterium]